MKNINNIISEEINNYIINEVRYVDTTHIHKKNSNDRFYNQEPIRNNETIRVFHGCTFETALHFALNGIDGQSVHSRRFSYEMGMNPIGLFVSTDFNSAADLAQGVVIEFTANTNDLDFPVWNQQDTYFGQDSQPIPFKNNAEREQQKQNYTNRAKENEHDYVRNSDNPALANSIYNDHEHQALFVSNLNPNQIKRFWVINFINGKRKLETYDRKFFIKKYIKSEKYTSYENQQKKYPEKYRDMFTTFKPNDDFISFEDVIKKLKYPWDNNITQNDLKSFFDEAQNDKDMREVLRNFFYPKQLIQILGKDKYDEYYGFHYWQ